MLIKGTRISRQKMRCRDCSFFRAEIEFEPNPEDQRIWEEQYAFHLKMFHGMMA